MADARVTELTFDGLQVCGATVQHDGAVKQIAAREVILTRARSIRRRCCCAPASDRPPTTTARHRAAAQPGGRGSNLQNHPYLHMALTLPPRSRLAGHLRRFAVAGRIRLNRGLFLPGTWISRPSFDENRDGVWNPIEQGVPAVGLAYSGNTGVDGSLETANSGSATTTLVIAGYAYTVTLPAGYGILVPVAPSGNLNIVEGMTTTAKSRSSPSAPARPGSAYPHLLQALANLAEERCRSALPATVT